MKTLFGYGTVMALAMAAVACGKSSDESKSSTLEVTGTVNTQLRTLDNASAVAIGSDGRTFSAYIEKNGRFKLALPVGHVYRVVIANSTMQGELRTVGHLVNPTSTGKADVIAVKEGGKLNLGKLTPAGAVPSNGLKTQCDCNGSSSSGSAKSDDSKDAPDNWDDSDENDKDESNGDSDKSGSSSEPADGEDSDYACHQKDQDKDRVCGEDSVDIELKAENSPGDKCAKEEADEEAPKVVKKSCKTKDDNKDGMDDWDESSSPSPKEEPAEDNGEDKKSGGYGGDDKSSPPKDTADPPKPSTKPGAACTCSQQCGAGGSCVASKCVSDKEGSSSSPK